jgi:hypothetical protein
MLNLGAAGKRATPGSGCDVEQNCTMRQGWNAQVFDRQAIVKSGIKKVRQKQCRNGAETQRRKAATEA